MADGLCVQGTARRENDIKVKDTVDILNIAHKDCMKAKNVTSVKPSFYIRDDNGELCSTYRVNGVLSLGVHATKMLCGANSEHVEFPSLCPNEGDNCRKKRCADRYDSSESSDSGVATLSCTDCSASSSSSGTSDITEPCSPYSPASSTHSSSNSESGDDQLQQQRRQQQQPQSQRTWSTASQMAPNVPSEGERERNSGPWSWTGGSAEEEERGPPPPPPPLLASPAPAAAIAHRRSAASVAASRSPSPSHKRLKVELHHTPLLHGKRCCKAAAVAARQQGKITEYFKTQAKPVSGAKKELVALAAKAGAVTVPRRVADAREGRKGAVEEASGPVGAVCRRMSSAAQKLSSLLAPPPPPPAESPARPLVADASGPTETSPPLDVEAPPVADGDSLHLVVSPPGPVSSSKPSLSSPILSVPRTIRFPAVQCSKAPTQLDTQDAVVCQWSDCDVQFETSTALLEHLQVTHVNPQTQSQISCEGENYVCLWTSCKVYGRTSCSRSWLERHVLSHGGNKPFRCIVDGCGQRFSSQMTLLEL